MNIALPVSRWLWRQRWLPWRWKKSAYKTLNRAGEAPDAPFTMDFYGLEYQGNLRNGIEFAMFYYGAFEKPLLYFLRDTLQTLAPDGGVFCDIGANIGQHSLFMCRVAKRVHAFEPLPTLSARLRQQSKLNAITNIEVHEVGLGEDNADLPFYAPSGTNQGIGSFNASSLAQGNQAVGELTVVRGDDYFPAQSITRIDLIKIDVEGFEKKVLTGLEQTLARQRPVLVVEISYSDPLSFDSREELQQLLPPGYLLFIFDTRKPNGRTARRRGARAKRSGAYRLIPLDTWRQQDQDDIIAIPRETLPRLGKLFGQSD